MVQPAFSPASSELAPPAADGVLRLPVSHRAEGPANQLLSELALALSADSDIPGAQKWSTGASLRFIFATCGGFWLVAAVLFYTFH